MRSLGIGKLASISGRFYSMDRDKRWERIQLAYDSMLGYGKRTSQDAFTVIQEAYKNAENDQIFVPTTIVDKEGKAVGPIQDNDVVIFYNYREDRAREMTKAFVSEDIDALKRENAPKNIYFVTMTGYEEDLDAHVIFPSKKIEDPLAMVLAGRNLNQLHISETEKQMHVTYFFNGGLKKKTLLASSN